MAVRLERIDDGIYREPITGTMISRVTGYGSGIGPGQTVWDMESESPAGRPNEGANVLARTLGEARSFLQPFLERIEG